MNVTRALKIDEHAEALADPSKLTNMGESTDECDICRTAPYILHNAVTFILVLSTSNEK